MLRWEGDVRNERHTTPSSIQLPKKTMCSHVQRLTHMHRLWHLFHCAGVYGIVTAAGLNHSGRKMKRGEGVTVLSTVLVLSVLYSPAEAVICHHQLKGVKSFVESEHLHLHNQMCTPNPRWDAEKAKVKNFFASELPPERLSVSLSLLLTYSLLALPPAVSPDVPEAQPPCGEAYYLTPGVLTKCHFPQLASLKRQDLSTTIAALGESQARSRNWD